MALPASFAEVVRELRRREAGGPRAFTGSVPAGSTGIGSKALEQLLVPHHPQPGLIEWLSSEASGAMGFAFLNAAQALESRPEAVVVVIDPEEAFYPVTLPAWGIPLERLLLIRPRSQRDALWSWEQALRCPGVAACIGPMPEATSVALRRLQVATEQGGVTGHLLRPLRVERQAHWADLRWKVTPLAMGAESQKPRPRTSRRFRVELLRHRGQMSGGVAEVEVTHETLSVRVAAAVADPAVPWRATGS